MLVVIGWGMTRLIWALSKVSPQIPPANAKVPGGKDMESRVQSAIMRFLGMRLFGNHTDKAAAPEADYDCSS